MGYHPQPNGRLFDLAQFKDERFGDVTLLHLSLAHVKLPCLTVVIGEACRAVAHLAALFISGKRPESGLVRFTRTAFCATPGVRLVIDASFWINHRHVPILLKMMEGTFRSVDGNMREVGSAEPLYLRVEVGEISALQQWIIAKVYSWDDVVGAEGDLLGFCEEVIDAAIQDKPSYATYGH